MECTKQGIVGYLARLWVVRREPAVTVSGMGWRSGGLMMRGVGVCAGDDGGAGVGGGVG